MADRANKILAFIFEGNPNDYERHMLMGLFTKVINMDQPLKQYSKFFTSNLINEKTTTCFAQIIQETKYYYQELPTQCSKKTQLTFIDT
jgi:hypothetical protein